MSDYLCLLRAVNVGKRQVKMAELRGWLVEAGFTDVETYIQTGNVALSSTSSAEAVREQLEHLLLERTGFEVPTFVWTRRDYADVAAWATAQPAPDDVKRYVSFFGEPLSAQAREAIAQRSVDLLALDDPPEGLAATDRAVHLWTKASVVDLASLTLLKAHLDAGTNRNLRVVQALAERWPART